MSKTSSETKDLTNVLQKFPKNELIKNFFENEEKENSKINKRDVIEKAIGFLTEKFSDLDELILFLHLKYLETEKVKKRKWNVFEIENARAFSKSTQSHEKISKTLIKYFNKYGTPCKVYSEKKGPCIWMALRFEATNFRPNVIYLVAHTKLSVIFLSHMNVYPTETAKVLRKSCRGSDVTQHNPINENAFNFSNLNFKSFQILKNINGKRKANRVSERKKKTEIAEVYPVERRILRVNRISEKTNVLSVKNNVLREKEALSKKNNVLKETEVSSTSNNILKNAEVKTRKTEKAEAKTGKNRLSEKAKAKTVKNGISKRPEVEAVKNRVSRPQVKNVISEKTEVLPVRNTRSVAKSKTYGKRAKVFPESRSACNYNVIEEDIENDQRKRKFPHKSSENQNVPTVESLQYVMISSPIYEENENNCDNSIFSVKFDGNSVLKGLKEMVDSGVADGPLPRYLYKEPRTGKTKFQLDFR